MTGTAELDAEIVAYERRLQRVSGDDPCRPPLLNNLAARLRARFGMTGDQSDLEHAVLACQEAIASIDPAGRQAPVYLNSLGNCLAESQPPCACAQCGAATLANCARLWTCTGKQPG
jgi:hypothetical protein